MLSFNISFAPDIERVGRNLDGFPWEKIFKGIVEEAIKGTERFAKQLTPVDTGRLRASIGGGTYQGKKGRWTKGSYPSGHGIKLAPYRGEIGSNVKYAPFVHEGTKFMRGRPFLREGARHMVRTFRSDKVNERLSKEFRRAFVRL